MFNLPYARVLSAAVLLPSIAEAMPAPMATPAPSSVVAYSIPRNAGNQRFLLRGLPLAAGTVVYATPEAMRRALGQSNGMLTVSNCSCLLEPGPTGDCFLRQLVASEVPARYRELGPRRVHVLVGNAVQFVRAWNAVKAAAAAVPPTSPPPPPPAGPTPPASAEVLCIDAATACKPAGNIDFSVAGETTFTAGCENGISIEVATSGEVNLKANAGAVTLTVPVRRAPGN